MLGRSYPPANVRSAAWYLGSVALMAVPVYFLLSSTVSQTPEGAVQAAPALGRLIPAAIGLLLAAVLLYAGFRFMYPVVLVLLLVVVGRGLMASERDLLQILIPLPALLLLVSPSAWAWFLGTRRKAGPVVMEREFHLPQR